MAKKSPASILKSKGLIPKDWDLRSLSRGQKSWITKLTRPGHIDKWGEIKAPGKFAQVVKKPAEFSSVKVSTKAQRKMAKSAGLPVSSTGRAVVHTGKGGRVRRKGDKIEIITPSRRMDVWFANSKTFQKAVNKARNRKLKPNQVWGFHIGNRVNSVQHRDFGQLMNYLEEKDDWHSPDATDYISLVLITENREQVVAHNTYEDGNDD